MRNGIFGRPGRESRSLNSWFFALFSVITNGLLAQSAAISANAEAQVIDGWGKTVAPRCDATFESKDDSLTITVARDGAEGPAKSDDFQAPRVVQSVEGDFAIEVTIGVNLPLPDKPDAADPTWKAYVSGGLLIWIDGKNYVRLVTVHGAVQ